MKKRIALIFLIIFSFLNPLYAQELKTLSLQECIDIALKKNPDILASKSTVEKSFFKIGEARSGYFPEIDLSLGYQRTYQESKTGEEYSKQYSGQINLTQTLFDFGKTSKQVQVQEELYKSTQWQDKDTLLQTIYNVKEAYFSALKAKKQKETALEVIRQSKRHLDLAKGFYEVGLKPKIEVTKAEVELSNATLNLITAEKQLSQALLNLKVAMGAVDMQDFDIRQEEYAVRKLDEKELLDIAIERNPQLQAIKFNKQASISTEELVKKEYMPKFTGSASYGYLNEDFPLDKKWTLFLQMSLPLFSGWSTTYKLKQAKADTTYYSYKEDSIRQQITSQIKNLFVQLKEASQKIETLKIALKQAKENLDLAMGRYEVGIGSSIEVVDAIVLYEQTNTQYWQAIYDYNVTYAQIQKTVGWAE
ncbi:MULTISPECIES: TolC family protein [Thermodesulfovibrio]|uniref:Outer membrane efflux protein n=2 Tax=Thermodesulfovibrio yellowstonii TaxID=28262 RepID=B5YHE9_THEYD|nr:MULTISPECIES: TolC family protein [Thermodesulfovibrio]ACI20969.1 outer membrane efflux protein [Thermodesulfovibrio yellowstonii DSM 11347]MDI6865441.1 TolC family protein [Thermodesulfovibrio yellowstonii]GLI52655.1 outer membrane efflux protein [Thermodesulfovibrio islandicus]